MKDLILSLIFLLSCISAHATNLQLSTPILYLEDGTATAVFNLSWDNAWHNEKNHDAIWLFCKSIPNEGQAHHIRVLPQGHEVVANFSPEPVELDFEVAADSVGVFIFPEADCRGNISLTLTLALSYKDLESLDNRNSSLSVFGIEMVHIPEGGFTLGEPGERAKKYGGIYRPQEGTAEVQLPYLSSETAELKVAPDGDLFYERKEGYEGDQTGTIPANFPKGVAAFYMMKYEITEGQYAAFLNTLSNDQRPQRDITQDENYRSNGGTIYWEEEHFATPYASKPCAGTSWDDAMAFADWAGLRPMTEFEFTKAARGPRKPRASEYPWGTSEKYLVQRLPNVNGVLMMNNGWTEEALSDDNLAYCSASYYWVMDLSGSLWERVVSIGHPVGRSFTGTHGDGKLSPQVSATNTDWPVGTSETGGVGFRGGGFYGYNREYHQFNPFSPIAYRPYGGWHGTNRSKAYGGRLVRSK